MKTLLKSKRSIERFHIVVVFLMAVGFMGVAVGLHATGSIEIGATRIVIDGIGREVEIPQSPERVVIAGRSALMIADAVYLFEGGGDSLVGVGRIDQGRGNFLEAIDPEYGEKAVLERNAGSEQILALNPDLVILKSIMKNTLGDQLESFGAPVIYVDLETPEQYERDLRVLGAVLQQESRAEELIAFVQGVIGAVGDRVGVASPADRPSTLFIYADLQSDGLVYNVPPPGWIQTRLVEMAGGEPVWTQENGSQGWMSVNLEQIAAWNPDRIFLVSYREDPEPIVGQLKANPTWQGLQAVQTGQIHAFPVDYYSWDQPDVRWVLGLQWLAARMHPEAFRDIDLRDSVRAFFATAYHLSDQEIDRVIFAVLTGTL